MTASVARECRYVGNLGIARNMRHGRLRLLRLFLLFLENTHGHLLAGVGVNISKLIFGSEVARRGVGSRAEAYGLHRSIRHVSGMRRVGSMGKLIRLHDRRRRCAENLLGST